MDTITTHQSMMYPLLDSTVFTAIVSSLTTIFVMALGLLVWWVKKQWQTKHEAKTEIRSKEKEVFTRMLENHSRQFAKINVHSLTKHNFEDNLAITRELLVWSADGVLAEYALYMQSLSPEAISKLEKREIHFGKAILAFRKQLGYRNKRVTPEQAAIVFKAVWGSGNI
ncbi:MAG: hypothetical protein KKG06_02415 [Bacteroidetes bacterium]|nr:hypothetical protein [Bacteroidota bacterium]